MQSKGPNTSRRKLLGAMVVTPAMAAAAPSIISPMQAQLDLLSQRYDSAPVKLVRSTEGRSMSLDRYESAHEFFPDPRKPLEETADILYYAGITAQLGLSAHLLDVGFPDQWCAGNIGLRVALSLGYANATGLDHHCPRMLKLARVLTPYWKWNACRMHGRRSVSDGGFRPEEVRKLLGAMLKQVRLVTGHPADREMLLREGEHV